ncbi:helix-turn-helix domain-containing protein [Sphaerimonospora sp. CA-214678]|uniref:helix-turn-helix domain-containing protein n=1 Tax=Sphaerimonospora sp. CA-214678 TaxID=3240029 RepID=UPI003D92875B
MSTKEGSTMTRKIGYVWHLRQLMAERGMFATTALVPLLAERQITLSREQVYRLVTGTPERMNLAVLVALADILECQIGNLLEPVRPTARTEESAKTGPPPADLRPVVGPGTSRSGPVDYLRHILMAGGVLPARDDDLARVERWLNEQVTGLDSPEHRHLVQAFATWRVIRALRERSAASRAPLTPTGHARLQITTAIAFLTWLSQRGQPLAHTRQKRRQERSLISQPALDHVGDGAGCHRTRHTGERHDPPARHDIQWRSCLARPGPPREIPITFRPLTHDFALTYYRWTRGKYREENPLTCNNSESAISWGRPLTGQREPHRHSSHGSYESRRGDEDRGGRWL